MKTRFVIERDSEGSAFFVSGVHVGNTNHDEHGWAGMEACEALFIATAAATGAEVVER